MTIEGPVGIVGMGVMGGSLARALAARGVPVRAYSADSDDAGAALAAGVVSTVVDSVEASAAGAAWWIVATPLAALPEVFAAGRSGQPARVMDLASLQRPAIAAAGAAGLAPIHRSAHPMVGSERSGFAASSADLYEGAEVWISRPEGGAGTLDAEVDDFWRALGAAPESIDPRVHDRRMAAASHLPQLAANALALVLEESGLAVGDLGPGGRDATRLAGSSPRMWSDLLPHSAADLAPLLKRLSEESAELARLLDHADHDTMAALLARTRRWRSG